MQIHFTAISEPSLPGKKWQKFIFHSLGSLQDMAY